MTTNRHDTLYPPKTPLDGLHAEHKLCGNPASFHPPTSAEAFHEACARDAEFSSAPPAAPELTEPERIIAKGFFMARAVARRAGEIYQRLASHPR